MKSRSFTFYTQEATECNSRWTLKQQLWFHSFNPAGLLARKRRANELISNAVTAGALKSGAIIAYGTFNHFYDDKLMAMLEAKRLNAIHFWVTTNGLREACEKAEAVAANAGFAAAARV